MIPKITIIPGKTIEAEIKARNLSQKEVAKKLGTSEKNLIELIKGNISISPELALNLEKVFGISAQFWMNLQAKYDLAKIEEKDEKKELFNIIKLTVDKQLQKV